MLNSIREIYQYYVNPIMFHSIKYPSNEISRQRNLERLFFIAEAKQVV